MKWIKASERMPDNCGEFNKVIIRSNGFSKDQFGHSYNSPFVTYGFRNYSDDPKFYFTIGGNGTFLTNENIEWLDESDLPNEPSIDIRSISEKWVGVWQRGENPNLFQCVDEAIKEALKGEPSIQEEGKAPDFDLLFDIDMECAMLEDVLHGAEVKRITKIRGYLKQVRMDIYHEIANKTQHQPPQDERVYPNEKVIGVKFEDRK